MDVDHASAFRGVACIARESIEAGMTVVAVSGAADEYAAAALRQAVDGAVATRGAQVIVDLSEASFLDSAILGWLIAAYRSTEGDGVVRMAIVCPDDSDLREMFSITALDELIPVRATRGDARAALQA